MRMINDYGMGAGGWLLMALFWIALIALVVFAVMRMLPARAEAGPALREPGEDPREILKRRLASGEIDVDTYDQLSAKVGPTSPSGRG